jgi:glutamine amidotransferase
MPAVIFASERMDDDQAWRMLAPGELVRVDGDLSVTSRVVIERPPKRPMEPDEDHHSAVA